VSVSYNGVRDLVVPVSVSVYPAFIPWGIWGQTRVWHSKARCGVRVPLPKHDGCSLLRYPKNRSQTISGGLTVEVVHQLGDGFGIVVPLTAVPLVCGLV
jgi:hypothetical protein